MIKMYHPTHRAQIVTVTDEMVSRVLDPGSSGNWIEVLDTNSLRRGDILYFPCLDRTSVDSRFIYDGGYIIPYSINEGGSIPLIFDLPVEFPPRYWSGTIGDNIPVSNGLIPYRRLIGQPKFTEADLRLTSSNHLVATLRTSGGEYYFVDRQPLNTETSTQLAIVRMLQSLNDRKRHYLRCTNDTHHNLDPNRILLV